MLKAHLLKHADARYLLVDLVALKIAVVSDLDGYLLLESFFEDSKSRDCSGFSQWVPREPPHAVMARGMQHKSVPAASNVQPPLPGRSKTVRLLRTQGFLRTYTNYRRRMTADRPARRQH
jgi:hypothetical protein